MGKIQDTRRKASKKDLIAREAMAVYSDYVNLIRRSTTETSKMDIYNELSIKYKLCLSTINQRIKKGESLMKGGRE